MGFRCALVLAVASMALASATATTMMMSNVTTSVTIVPPFLLPSSLEDTVDDLYLKDDLELNSQDLLQSLVEEARSSSQVSLLDTVKTNFIKYINEHARSIYDQSSEGRTFASLEVALLSLAFLTFAVFLIDLVQDLFSANGRRFRRDAPEPSSSLPSEESTTDLIVLVLSSIDTVANYGANPDCGQKFLCHLNRSGWNAPGLLGEGANYATSAILSFFSGAGFEEGLKAANLGRDDEDCKIHFSECPSVIRSFIPSNEAQSHPTEEKFDKDTEEQ